MIRIVLGALAVLLVLSACSAIGPEKKTPVPLLLISIDGLRHDYLDLADTPNFDRLRNGGLAADSLQHVFPTKTFPTHYTMVTGLHPGSHGVVANNMWDKKSDRRFALGNRTEVENGYWYQAGEPIWVTAERQQLIAATYFWPGSEARIRRVRPTHWKRYQNDVPHAERIAQVLEWLNEPVQQRPDFLTLYFSTVDSAGHRAGPGSPEVIDALEEIDAQLGTLLDGLERKGLLDRMHLIVVSDHGMAAVDSERQILLEDYLDLSKVLVSDWGPAAQIWVQGDQDIDAMAARLNRAHRHMRAWARPEIPARYRFGQHHRVPDLLIEADLGWMITNRAYLAARARYALGGMHGWDPAHTAMHGLFIAHGPAFAPGSVAPTVRSIDLYALMARLLNLKPARHEGSLQPFSSYLEGDVAQVAETSHWRCGESGEALRLRSAVDHIAVHWRNRTYVALRAEPDHFAGLGIEVQWTDDRLQLRFDEFGAWRCQAAST